MRFASFTSTLVIAALGACALGGCASEHKGPTYTVSQNGSAADTPTAPEVPTLVPTVLATHDIAPTFVQGLQVIGDSFLLSTGLNGESTIQYRDRETYAEQTSLPLDDAFFGEGATLADGSVWQLTWKAGVAFQRDPDTLEERARFTYDGEGWGLCAFDGTGPLYLSDGSATIRAMNTADFQSLGNFTIRDAEGQPISRLNELECAEFRGQPAIYANIFTTDEIVVFSPRDGELLARIDASGLDSRAPEDPNTVLNGIAAGENGRFYLTGKNWPVLYEVEWRES
ncbi:glutaminyl-peptide cyclotransferase [Corynebacterium sp. TAE3-ERU30]|uniref:glutaminyl-peptide cyclotransferase n=1 Tax=Corynebacterium sp. TAE3-ERU30 TaxID=2849496 RepID=UPI001C4577A3|nr:glutaminyl-peptide cyclotransferase [Corynebacterium sp. TAE3-ERU30]MBV7281385.1 glutaminyl-peptide cyclotransferase [Corynebacterium sp. TAE3-ERU30]